MKQSSSVVRKRQSNFEIHTFRGGLWPSPPAPRNDNAISHLTIIMSVTCTYVSNIECDSCRELSMSLRILNGRMGERADRKPSECGPTHWIAIPRRLRSWFDLIVNNSSHSPQPRVNTSFRLTVTDCVDRITSSCLSQCSAVSRKWILQYFQRRQHLAEPMLFFVRCEIPLNACRIETKET